MSQKQQHHEALRWLATAQEDYAAAQLLKEKNMYSHSCFLAQQCAEKALKALWQELDDDPWGHSVQKLIRDLPGEAVKNQFVPLLEKAATLDRYYIPARYPNGLPDLTPGTTFVLADAELACDNARLICGEVKQCLKGEPQKE
jgi:HEPN domain-containing protein